MIVLGIVETIEEIVLIFMYPNWVAGVKGLYWAFRDRRRKNAQMKQGNQE
jgi:CDP-diacylglycerol--glycerol-3-phosphate 3-phosphatidyltransferase